MFVPFPFIPIFFFTSVTWIFYHSYHSWKDHIPSELTSEKRPKNERTMFLFECPHSKCNSKLYTVYWISYFRMVALEQHSTIMMKFAMHFHTYSRYFIAIFSIHGTIWVPNAMAVLSNMSMAIGAQESALVSMSIPISNPLELLADSFGRYGIGECSSIVSIYEEKESLWLIDCV